jgi:protein MpaA
MHGTVTHSCRILLVAATLLVAPHPHVGHAATHDRTVVRHALLGRSAFGRPIRITELGDPDERRKLLVIGCIHGSECAGIAVARELARGAPLANADLWIVENLNPDGFAAGTRINGRGVDLNRNFPWHWRPLESPGSLHYAGPRPLSEPESRLAAHLILRLRPAVTIWFHQALDVVDESGGSVAIERRFADLVGLPLVRLPRYPGSATSWQDHVLPGTTAFVVELHGGALSGSEVGRFASAVRTLAAPDEDSPRGNLLAPLGVTSRSE